jgi:hypothetical protein
VSTYRCRSGSPHRTADKDCRPLPNVLVLASSCTPVIDARVELDDDGPSDEEACEVLCGFHCCVVVVLAVVVFVMSVQEGRCPP